MKSFYNNWEADINESDANTDPDPQPTLDQELGKFIEFLVIGLTGKDLHQQNRVLRESRGRGFAYELANKSEKHLRWLCEQMDDDSIEPMIWKINKLKHLMQKYERLLENEEQSREARRWLDEK